MDFLRTIRSVLLPALLLPVMCMAQDAAPADQVSKLRDQIAAQQRQLDEQRQALDAAQKALAAAQQSIDSQQKLLDRLVAAQPAPAAAAPQTATAPVVAPPAPAAAEVDSVGRPFSPLGFHIGGAEFTPNGFMDLSTVWRSRDIGTGPGTTFGSVPFSNTSAGRLDEIRTSAQTSRFGLSVTDHPTASIAVTGYIEADFVGNQATSLYVTSDSNTLRMRHFYVDVQKGKWEVLGGQTWTLLIPNRNGVSSAGSNVFLGLGEDANYLVGLPWTRPGQFRLVYHANKNWTIAASIENPEQFVTAATTVPAFASTQVDNGTLTTTPNVRPDIIAKIAYDKTVSGKAFHVDVAGISSQFRVTPAAGVFHGAQGVGGTFNAILEVAKNFRLVGNVLYGTRRRTLPGRAWPRSRHRPQRHHISGAFRGRHRWLRVRADAEVAVVRLLRWRVFRPQLHGRFARQLSRLRLPRFDQCQPADSGGPPSAIPTPSGRTRSTGRCRSSPSTLI